MKRRNPEKRLVAQAKHNAKVKGLDFDLTPEDIQIPKTCPYFGFPLTLIFGQGPIDTNVSIDRIDNSKGYVKGNIQIISCLANRMKLNASIEQLVQFAEGVLRLHGRESDIKTPT